MTVRLLLADDHLLFRQGLRALLEPMPGFDVVGEAADGREAIRRSAELEPDVVVMDLTMPGLNGFDATRELADRLPACRVVVLSMHSDPRFVARALDAGAVGYVLKEAAFDELADAIRAAVRGGRFLSVRLRQAVPEAAEESSPLSPREREVVQLLAEGRGTRGAAETLGISPKTVETHRANAMRKLGVDSIAELTKYAVREGLTPLE